jgi:hypothetical protein
MAPFETIAEASEKHALDLKEKKILEMRTGSSNDLSGMQEKINESAADLAFQTAKMRQDALLSAERMKMAYQVRDIFQHFDSDQVLNIQVVGNTAHVMVKDTRDGLLYPLTMAREHKTWHITQLEPGTLTGHHPASDQYPAR